MVVPRTRDAPDTTHAFKANRGFAARHEAAPLNDLNARPSVTGRAVRKGDAIGRRSIKLESEIDTVPASIAKRDQIQ